MFFNLIFRKADQVWGVDQSYLYRLFFRLLDRKGREERKGLIIPMDSNKQGSEEARLSNLSNLFSDFIRERDWLISSYGRLSPVFWRSCSFVPRDIRCALVAHFFCEYVWPPSSEFASGSPGVEEGFLRLEPHRFL
jgi:hypothetical protein